MNAALMMKTHEAGQPWAWSLAPGCAARIAAKRRARWLWVMEGRVWLTCNGAGSQGECSGDVWLNAGQGLCLPARSTWVIEGWPQAQVALLEEAEAQGTQASFGAMVASVMRHAVVRVGKALRKVVWGRRAGLRVLPSFGVQ
jgi:hypothetical protein